MLEVLNPMLVQDLLKDTMISNVQETIPKSPRVMLQGSKLKKITMTGIIPDPDENPVEEVTKTIADLENVRIHVKNLVARAVITTTSKLKISKNFVKLTFTPIFTIFFFSFQQKE